jgi:hypothetical protein
VNIKREGIDEIVGLYHSRYRRIAFIHEIHIVLDSYKGGTLIMEASMITRNHAHIAWYMYLSLRRVNPELSHFAPVNFERCSSTVSMLTTAS